MQRIVTKTERRVIVEQPQPNADVRSSKRSDCRGQMECLKGSRMEEAGMQVED